MKKQIAILLVILLCLGMGLSLSGCSEPTVSVRSQLVISDSFAGRRTVTVVYPLSAPIDAVKDQLLADAPDVDGAQFRYVGVEEDGYHFALELKFKNKAQYETIVASLLGRGTTVFLSRKNTCLTQGVRMSEDFDVSELIAWVTGDTAADEQTRGLRFAYDTNTVQIGDDTYDAASTVSINDCKGSPIASIAVKTSNDKAGSYDRTFIFTVPNDTYAADKEAVEQYFLTNTLPDSQYAGWASEGANMIYTVIYQGMDLKKMTEATAKLLDTDSAAIYYGDIDNASTPLSEGMTFEESLDTLSFISGENGCPPLYYSYSLPLNTTYGEGSVFEEGRWVSAGAWKDGLYTVELKDGSARLRIPDGVQYHIRGVNFTLTSLGDARFRRETDFVYDSADTAAARYAESYFIGKGAECAVSDEDGVLVCGVTFEGTTEEITDKLVRVFGSGNFLTYRQSAGAFDLSVKTELTDYVNLGYMLDSDNAAALMDYTVISEGGENIVSVSVDDREVPYDGQIRDAMNFEGGVTTVRYHGNIPIASHIALYIAAGAVLLGLTAFVCILLLRPKRRRRYADPLNNPDIVYDAQDMADAPSGASDDAAQPSLAQTTTFSIFELNTLVRNKKVVDEINKDVEERLHAQSIEEQKHDIRARELEEMSRRVYGEAASSSEEDQPDQAPAGEEADD